LLQSKHRRVKRANDRVYIFQKVLALDDRAMTQIDRPYCAARPARCGEATGSHALFAGLFGVSTMRRMSATSRVDCHRP
jgi:hypothetical protein